MKTFTYLSVAQTGMLLFALGGLLAQETAVRWWVLPLAFVSTALSGLLSAYLIARR